MQDAWMSSYHERKPPEQCSKPWNCTAFWVQGQSSHAQVRIAWSTNDSKRVDAFASTKMMSANMLHPGCRTPWKYWDELHINWFLRIVSPQGCRTTVHPRYEEADTFIWKMLRRWTTPPGNYANVGYQQDSCWDGNCLTLHIHANRILNYSDCKVCPSFIVLLLSLRRMRNRWVAVISRYQIIINIYSFHFKIHIFAWRSIRFLQILSEAVSGHTHLNQTSDSSV